MLKQNKKTKFIHLGLKDYQEALDYQKGIFKRSVDQKISNRKVEGSARVPTDNFLIFCSHPHVYTLGKSGKPENLLLDEAGLREKEIQCFKIGRGGDITYHGPGQIVGYPILDLDNFFTDIHKYLRFLEEAIILTLKDYEIDAGRLPGFTGVWLDPEDENRARKICAIGVRTSRWVTMHGFAFNVNVDLDYFDYIIPCDIDDKAVTSLNKELGYDPGISEVEKRLRGHIVKLFEMELIE